MSAKKIINTHNIKKRCLMRGNREKLVELNKSGLIHAPDESDESFVLRCRHAAETIKKDQSAPLSQLAVKLLDIEPSWVQIIYENKGLRIWEGGCTWIGKEHVKLQLNKAFLKHQKYFGYSQEEVIAHELVHVVRSGFEEPIFEEMLAYQTSYWAFRRYFGPVLRTTKETMLVITAFSLVVFATLFSIFQTVMYVGMLGLITGGSFRLLRTQRIFHRTRRKLTQIVGKDYALPIMLRLTDREIMRFSKMGKQEIVAYAKKMRKCNIRWQQIFYSYFESITGCVEKVSL